MNDARAKAGGAVTRDQAQRMSSIRRPYYHANVPFVVAWSQKAGCTAALKWFLFHAGLLEEALVYKTSGAGLHIHAYENHVLKARRGYGADVAAYLRAGGCIVNFIRCPYERAFSSYRRLNNEEFFAQQRRGANSQALRSRKSILRYLYGGDVPIESPVSFRDYLLWLHTHDDVSLDRHDRPQYSAIYEHPAMMHFRLENFFEAIDSIEQAFGLVSSRNMATAFAGRHHRPKTDMGAAETLEFLEKGAPLRESEAFPTPRVTRALLRGTSLGRLIAERFQQDIAVYDATSDGAVRQKAERLTTLARNQRLGNSGNRTA